LSGESAPHKRYLAHADTPVTAQASIGDNAEIVENSVRYNPVIKGWRMTDSAIWLANEVRLLHITG
jgi:glucan biosynthesis protein